MRILVGIDFADLMSQANLTFTVRRRGFSPDPSAVAAHAREFILAPARGAS
jgi:hypothetical protein